MDKFDFFKQLSLNISSSLEPDKVWPKTFQFLSHHFPIEALCLHWIEPQTHTLHLEYLINAKQCIELNCLLSLGASKTPPPPKSEVMLLNRCLEDRVSRMLLGNIQSHLVDSKDRAMLVVVLETEEGVIGHLGLIGKTIDCFTPEHEVMLELIRAPIGLALMNMSQYVHIEKLKDRLDAERKQLEGQVRLMKGAPIIGSNNGLSNTMKLIEHLTGKEVPTLILGETGTGKELIADAIQQISPRIHKPFIKVNCGAIPESLIDSELFGHQKGAFTGAVNNKIGRFEQADGGTLFLDEVGELPLDAQVRLLRTLQNGCFERVGGTKTIRVDVRIIAATNRPLKSMIQSGEFREDLYYRLNVFPIELPALRQRSEDIPLLINHFVQEFSSQMGRPGPCPVCANSIDTLQNYSWPGNVRQLKNLVERAMTIHSDGELDLAVYLPEESTGLECEEPTPSLLKQQVRELVIELLAEPEIMAQLSVVKVSENNQALSAADPQTLDEVMIAHITKILKECNGKINGPGGAAEKLDINPCTLRKRMQKLGVPYGHKPR